MAQPVITREHASDFNVANTVGVAPSMSLSASFSDPFIGEERNAHGTKRQRQEKPKIS